MKSEHKFSNSVKTNKAFDLLSHSEARPWGSFFDLAKGGKWHLKIIEVSPSKRLSLQKHAKREEYWFLLDGDATAIRQCSDGTLAEMELVRGRAIHIQVGDIHRLQSKNGGRVAEISYGDFEEDDIIRVEDDFGRN